MALFFFFFSPGSVAVVTCVRELDLDKGTSGLWEMSLIGELGQAGREAPALVHVCARGVLVIGCGCGSQLRSASHHLCHLLILIPVLAAVGSFSDGWWILKASFLWSLSLVFRSSQAQIEELLQVLGAPGPNLGRSPVAAALRVLVPALVAGGGGMEGSGEGG